MTGRKLRDSVDALLDAWRGQRPDVELGPLEVFSRLSRVAVHLARARAEAFAAEGLEEWGFDVLAALRRTGAPYRLTPGALVRETCVSSATMSHRIDRLESAGLLRRTPDPADGRGVLVTLTPEGLARVDRALGLLAAAEAALLAPLGDRERKALTAALRHLLVAIEGD